MNYSGTSSFSPTCGHSSLGANVPLDRFFYFRRNANSWEWSSLYYSDLSLSCWRLPADGRAAYEGRPGPSLGRYASRTSV